MTTTLYGFTGVLTSLWGSTVPATTVRLGLTPTDLGMVLTTLAVGGLIAMLLTGRLVERGTSSRLLSWAGPVSALALLGPPLSPNVGSLLCSAFLLGLALGALNVALSVQAVSVERQLQRPVLSTMQGVWTLGAVAGGGVVTAALRAGVPGQAIILVGSAALLGAAIVIGSLVRRLAVVTGSLTPRSVPPSRPVPSRFVIVALGLIGSAAFISEGAATDWAGVHAVRILGADSAIGSLVYTAFFATMTVVRFLGDAIRGRLGSAKAIGLSGVVATAGFGLVLLSGVLEGSLWIRVICAAIGWAMAGAGMAMVWPIVISTLGELSRAERKLSGVATISYGGGLIGPVLIGFVAGAATLPMALLIPASLAAFVALGAPRILRTARRETERLGDPIAYHPIA
jgi:MFS family permease